MSQIVTGVGASHTTLMNTRWGEVDHLERAHEFRNGLAAAKARLEAAEPDLVVIVGTNHFRGFWLDLMPPFTIGVDEVIAAGEHGTPSGPQLVDPGAAQAVCQELMAAGLDTAFSTRLDIDHGISHSIQYLLPEGVPSIPIVLNVFAPPLPGLARCLTFGQGLRAALQSLPGERRVAVVGTGGLSHQIPFPDWRSPEGDDEEFLAHSFREGRGHWERYEARRRTIIVGARPQINADFDDRFLTLLESGELHTVPSLWSDEDIVPVAGNGGNEIRTWLVMAAALGHAPGQRIAYSAMPEWLTGMAVACIEPIEHELGADLCQSGPT